MNWRTEETKVDWNKMVHLLLFLCASSFTCGGLKQCLCAACVYKVWKYRERLKMSSHAACVRSVIIHPEGHRNDHHLSNTLFDRWCVLCVTVYLCAVTLLSCRCQQLTVSQQRPLLNNLQPVRKITPATCKTVSLVCCVHVHFHQWKSRERKSQRPSVWSLNIDLIFNIQF